MPKNKSGRVPDNEKLFEDLLEAKQKSDSEKRNLAHENASLRIAMSCKEATWQKEKESMQNADYEKLKEELQLDLKETKKELWIQEKENRSLNNRSQSQQAEIHKIRRDLNQQCNYVNELEYSIKQREQVIDRTVHKKQALEEQINELTNKLKAMETNVFQNEPDWQSEIKAVKDELSREQAEKEAGSSRIKELERLLKITEEKWVTKHETGIVQKDQKIHSLTSQNKALEASKQKLISMKQTMETRILLIKSEEEKKVDALEANLSCERAEKEAASKRIKELERMLKVTEEKWVTEHEAGIGQKDQMIASLTSQNKALEASKQKLISMKQAIETRIFLNMTEWETKVDALEAHLSCERAEKEAASKRIKKLERILKVTKEKLVTKHEATILQKDQKIASLTSQNMALETSYQKLISMQQAIETRIFLNMTEEETKVDALEDHLSCERAEKEAAYERIKELEKLVSNTDQMWAAKHEADIKLLILKQIKLQELALMTDKEKAKMEKKQKKAKKEAEKRPKKELKEKTQENSSLFSCFFSFLGKKAKQMKKTMCTSLKKIKTFKI